MLTSQRLWGMMFCKLFLPFLIRMSGKWCSLSLPSTWWLWGSLFMARPSFFVAVGLRVNSPFSYLWTAQTTSGWKNLRWVPHPYICVWLVWPVSSSVLKYTLSNQNDLKSRRNFVCNIIFIIKVLYVRIWFPCDFNDYLHVILVIIVSNCVDLRGRW